MRACACARVGEIASSVRNGAYAPYAAFYFFTKEEEQKLTDGINRARAPKTHLELCFQHGR